MGWAKSFELKICIIAGQGGGLAQERPATNFDFEWPFSTELESWLSSHRPRSVAAPSSSHWAALGQQKPEQLCSVLGEARLRRRRVQLGTQVHAGACPAEATHGGDIVCWEFRLGQVGSKVVRKGWVRKIARQRSGGWKVTASSSQGRDRTRTHSRTEGHAWALSRGLQWARPGWWASLCCGLSVSLEVTGLSQCPLLWAWAPGAWAGSVCFQLLAEAGALACRARESLSTGVFLNVS